MCPLESVASSATESRTLPETLCQSYNLQERLKAELEEKDKLLKQYEAKSKQKNIQIFIEGPNTPCNGEELKVQVICGQEFSVQWSRSFNGARFEPIRGATSASYTSTADDIGAVLKVDCTLKDTGKDSI